MLINNQTNKQISLAESVAIASYNEHGVIDISPATIRWLRATTESLIRFGGDQPMVSLSPKHVDDWQRHVVNSGITTISANSYLRALRILYNRLILTGHLAENPAKSVAYWPSTTPARRAVNTETYLSLLSVANARDKALLVALWCTGCRLGGLATMAINRMDHWQDKGHCFAIKVDEKGKHSKIKQRWVYLKNEEQNEGDLFWEWLQLRPKTRDPHIFLTLTNPTRTLNTISIQSVMRKLKNDAKIPDECATNAHAFRHAFATRKLDEGYDLSVVSAWLGHEDPEFTAQVYARRSESELRQIYFK